MRVIYTDSFQKHYNKNYKKYFSLVLLSQKLREKSHNFINLHDPFFKCKLSFQKVEFRGVIAFVLDDAIVPIFIAFKKDKKMGENISWALQKKYIEELFETISQEISDGKYTTF